MGQYTVKASNKMLPEPRTILSTVKINTIRPYKTPKDMAKLLAFITILHLLVLALAFPLLTVSKQMIKKFQKF